MSPVPHGTRLWVTDSSEEILIVPHRSVPTQEKGCVTTVMRFLCFAMANH
jgi:hypothetical protein